MLGSHSDDKTYYIGAYKVSCQIFDHINVFIVVANKTYYSKELSDAYKNQPLSALAKCTRKKAFAHFSCRKF